MEPSKILSPTKRHYDIDWIRVIAIGLLLIYHTAIGFQPWGMMIAFITNSKPWFALWTPMTMLNVWRIPLLFFVSGMGVYFAIQNRNWKQLIAERTMRIFVPFVFGMFCIVPIHLFIWKSYYKMDPGYIPDPAHLWFLGNIMAYVLIFAPLFYYVKRNTEGNLVRGLKKLLSTPLGILPVMVVFVAEAIIINPNPYEYYAMTLHGFILGLLAFLTGFCFMLSGENFWQMTTKWRWLFLGAGFTLYAIRMYEVKVFAPVFIAQLPVESICWIISILAFGHRYLNRPGKALTYLSQAAYPVYILHMIFLYLGSALIFPMDLPVQLKYVLVLVLTFAGCFGAYEIIRRIKWVRPLFGMRYEKE